MNNKNILLSIIIPVYNAEKFINETIMSIISQGYGSYELIIIDDGSKDNSYSLIKKFADRYDNIIIETQENQGATFARNRGLELAKGEYILFFDADDILEKNILNNILTIINNEYPDLILSNFTIVSEDLKYIEAVRIKDDSIENLFLSSPFPGNKIYKNKIIRENHLTFNNVRIGQDLNFYLKYLIHVKTIFIYEKNSVKYRTVKTSISNTYDNRIIDIIRSINYVEEYYHYKSVDFIYYKMLNYAKLKHYIYQYSKLRFIVEDKSFTLLEKKLSQQIKNTMKKLNLFSLKEIKLLWRAILSYYKTVWIIRKYI